PKAWEDVHSPQPLSAHNCILVFPVRRAVLSSATKIRGAHAGGAGGTRRRWGVMTSDEFPKSTGSGLGIDRGIGGEIGDEAASVIEVSGVIKWFDVSKGYGFIVPDNG